MGPIPRSRAGLVVVTTLLTIVFAWFVVRTAVRWRNLRALDRMVEAHDIAGAVDFTVKHFGSDTTDERRALMRLATLILHQGLDDRDPYERCFAATSLVRYGDWTGRPVINSSMSAKDVFLQKAAIEGLADSRDTRALDLLREVYDGGGRSVRVWTAEALAETDDHRVLPLLLSASTSSDEGVRLWGIWGLGRLHDPHVVGYLRSMATRETNPLISAAIADSLLKLGDRTLGAIELLEVTFYDPNPDRASNAALELGDAQDSFAVPQLRSALNNTALDLTVRLAAAAALTHYGNRDGLKLMGTVSKDPYLNGKLAPLLLYLNFHLSRSLLISAMASENVVLQLAATEAIGRLGGKSEIGILTAALDRTPDAFMTAQIAWSLGRIGGPETVRPLLSLLKSPNATVRYSAADALARTASRLLAGVDG